ncbi:MAG: hypothetical protein M1825_006464 [Sarcosagium campestre]|nr:MAG: hypothetical protein M1825_006464 [Sarcosagium campestre]
MQAFVPKNRRPKFELTIKIIDLNNVPLVSGSSYVKWHLAGSTSAEHRGRTPKAAIKDHRVEWAYEKKLGVRLTVDRQSMLQETELLFEVVQEYSAGARAERIGLGNVKLNLAEYVDSGEGDGEDVTRRYLMQESKINSTLKISITMKQIEGDRSFTAPPLRTAPAFGGIAGIISTEANNDADEAGQVSSMGDRSREFGELQDTYRRTLAASWASQTGELPADSCVEDLFAGGTGWASSSNATSGKNDVSQSPHSPRLSAPSSDGRSGVKHGFRTHKARLSGQQPYVSPTKPKPQPPTDQGPVETGHGSSSGTDGEGRRSKAVQEVDEFEVREDLRSWSLG